MTRERIEKAIHVLWWLWQGTAEAWDEFRSAVKTALDALEALPIVDELTGLVNFGGDRSRLWVTVGQGFWVSCGDIAQVNRYETEEQAKLEWNLAFGYKEET